MPGSGILEHNEARRKQMHIERVTNLQKAVSDIYTNTYENQLKAIDEEKENKKTVSKGSEQCGYQCIYDHYDDVKEKKVFVPSRAKVTKKPFCGQCDGKLDNNQNQGDHSYGMKSSPYSEMYAAKLHKRFTTTDFMMQW